MLLLLLLLFAWSPKSKASAPGVFLDGSKSAEGSADKRLAPPGVVDDDKSTDDNGDLLLLLLLLWAGKEGESGVGQLELLKPACWTKLCFVTLEIGGTVEAAVEAGENSD